MILTAFNIRGAKGKEEVIAGLLDRCHVLAVCETWRRPCDKADKTLFEEEVTTVLTHNRQRGYGGVAIAVHRVIRFNVTHTHSERTCQYITIRVRHKYVSMIYIPLAATIHTEQQVLCDIARKTRGKSVRMGDINGRYHDCDTTTNARGNRMKKLASTNEWHITAPKQPTCRTVRGHSTSEVFMTRGCHAYNTKFVSEVYDSCSVHLPDTASTTADTTYKPQNGPIRYRQRRNPVRLYEARKAFGNQLLEIMEKLARCTTRESVEQAYDEFR